MRRRGNRECRDSIILSFFDSLILLLLFLHLRQQAEPHKQCAPLRRERREKKRVGSWKTWALKGQECHTQTTERQKRYKSKDRQKALEKNSIHFFIYEGFMYLFNFKANFRLMLDKDKRDLTKQNKINEDKYDFVRRDKIKR